MIIDGDEMGNIKDGGRLRIELQPGEHVIQVKVDWCTSQTLRFTLAEGEVLKFRCGSPIRGWKLLLVLFFILGSPDNYLFIEQVEEKRLCVDFVLIHRLHTMLCFVKESIQAQPSQCRFPWQKAAYKKFSSVIFLISPRN